MKKNKVTRLLTLLLTLALIVGSITIIPTQATAANKNTKIGESVYTILSGEEMTVQYKKPGKKTCTTITIPTTVEISGKTYGVVSIANNAFKGCKKLKKVTIGKNVAKIGSKAFYGCKGLKTITINTTQLTKGSVGSKAFGKIHAKAVVTVPENKLAEYKVILKSAGLKGKGQEVMGKEEEALDDYNGEPFNNYDPSKPLPDPKHYGFTIGDFSKQNAAYIQAYKITESSKYGPGDEIPFTASAFMDTSLYGDWKFETITKPHYFERCADCLRFFQTTTMRAVHTSLICPGGRYVFGDISDPYDASVFYPDANPCKVVYQFTLPDGLSYKEGSLKVTAHDLWVIPSDNYDLKISGNQITVTINDIKAEPYYYAFNKTEYDKNPAAYESSHSHESTPIPINVLFYTEFNENAQGVNTVSGKMTYSYKGNTKTLDLGDRNICSTAMKINHTDMDGNQLSGGTFTLYMEKPVFENGSNLGTYEWVKVKSGLKSGDTVAGIGQNFYKLVQDTYPDGYKKYITPEFSVEIKDGGITALDNNSWTPLEVVNGVVQVVVKNKKGDGGNTPKSPETEAGISQSNKNQSVDVVVTYYIDGIVESSTPYSTRNSIATGLLDAVNIPNRTYDFKGYVLQKITLDGKEISKIPDYVPIGSTICYYYVTAGNN